MAQDITAHIIARIRTDFRTKFGVPRQSGLIPEAEGEIVFEPDYRNPDALRGIEGFSHLWLIWQFSEAVRKDWSPTVRPPRLGGNTRMGVFATRSPFRPNAIGLSSVRLLGVEQTADRGTVLRVAGADLMDGTPILDIKPYLAYTDSHPEATGGFVQDLGERLLTVAVSENARPAFDALPQKRRETVTAVLSHDPRPTYQKDTDRVYGMDLGDLSLHFTVENGVCTLTELTETEETT